MKGQQPERGRSQGRGVRHERNAAKRASILDGGPSGGYKRQHRLQRGAPLYCVDSTFGDVQLIRTLPRHAEAVSCLSLQFLFQLFYAQYQGLLFFESLPRHHVVQTIIGGGHPSIHLKKRGASSVCGSFLWVENLHMMVVEQISRRMVYLSDGHLEIYL